MTDQFVWHPILINKQLLGEKKTLAKFQNDISKSEKLLVRVYTDLQTARTGTATILRR